VPASIVRGRFTLLIAHNTQSRLRARQDLECCFFAELGRSSLDAHNGLGEDASPVRFADFSDGGALELLVKR
jgi:hypothetical protein